MKNIIIFGQMGSGKDTVAAMLELMGYTRFKLGAPIREFIDKAGVENKREGYQKYGQLMRETFNIDIWNNICYSDIVAYAMGLKEAEVEPTEYPVVIADGRQTNEYDYWTNQGFVPVAVVADEDVRAARLLARDGVDQRASFTHDTELQVGEIITGITQDIVYKGHWLDNNGSVEDLVAQIGELLQEIAN